MTKFINRKYIKKCIELFCIYSIIRFPINPMLKLKVILTIQ